MMQIMCSSKIQHLFIWWKKHGSTQGENAQLLRQGNRNCHDHPQKHCKQCGKDSHNSYIPSMPVLDVPDHVKLVSQTENLAKFMVLGVVASSGKKCPNEWVSADAYMK